MFLPSFLSVPILLAAPLLQLPLLPVPSKASFLSLACLFILLPLSLLTLYSDPSISACHPPSVYQFLSKRKTAGEITYPWDSFSLDIKNGKQLVIYNGYSFI